MYCHPFCQQGQGNGPAHICHQRTHEDKQEAVDPIQPENLANKESGYERTLQ
jgi:hypothetical protein